MNRFDPSLPQLDGVTAPLPAAHPHPQTCRTELHQADLRQRLEVGA